MAGLVQRITMQDVKEKLGKLSITNQYQVHFSILKKTITDYLESIGVDFYKIASFDITNFNLLQKIAKTNKPIITM